MEKLLNNTRLWLTPEIENFEGEAALKNMDFAISCDKNYTYIYYHQGSKIIDDLFKTDYTDLGYISTVFTTLNTVTIMFINSHARKVEDVGYFIINRKYIKGYREKPGFEKTIIDLSKSKDNFQRLRNATGLIGSAITSALDKKKPFHLITKQGSLFELDFVDANNELQTMELFAEQQYASNLRIFLNTYYKEILPQEAKKPASDSLCYIATACYEDLYAPEVITLRNFRDSFLMKYYFGRQFIKLYYWSSTFLYQPLLNSPKLSYKLKLGLNSFVKFLTRYKY